MEKSILIAASNYDEHAYGPVTAILDSKGFNVVTYLTDKALSGEDDFHVYVNEDAEVQLAYNGQPIDVENIGAAWFRKLLAFEPITSDPTKKLYINSEILHLHDTIWDLYPDNLWLNSPNNIKRADRKIRQLQVAKLAGFTIPPTIISSTWENIEQNLMPNYDEDIIVKTIRGIINDEETIKAHFTTVLTHEQILAMKNSVSPYLGLYQPFIDKLREWRVTVVGNDVHSASIETDLAAKDPYLANFYPLVF
ncbi:MAG: hypothetical protein NTX11_04600 [Candidatus Saccharibacteria bacterium]|nr:hypothetical protein [Candidatus Saccharibacteria bacterium]